MAQSKRRISKKNTQTVSDFDRYRTTNTTDSSNSTGKEDSPTYTPAIDSKKATRALLSHIDVATFASIEQSGTIDDIPANAKAINALSNNKLGFMIDELQGFQLSSAVTRYLQHTTQTSRLRASSQTLAGLVEELESKIATYHTLRRRGSSDIDFFEGEIKEWVMQIIDELSQATLHFSYQVHNVLNIIADLDIRISENRKALTTIDNLNVIFRHLSVEKLATLAGNDDFLQSLLLRLLKAKLDQSISELIQAGHQLRHNLTQLLQDKRLQALNEVVDAWYQYFVKNPTFSPDISLIAHAQPCFNIAEPLSLTSHADLDDPTHDAFIAGFAAQMAQQIQPLPSQQQEREEEEEAQEAVEDVSHDKPQLIDIDPFYQAIEQFFEALTTPDAGLTQLSGVQAWQTFFSDKPNGHSDHTDSESEGALIESALNTDDPSLEDWLLALVNHYYTYQSMFTPALALSFEEYPVPNYSGNHIVTDILIYHANREGALVSDMKPQTSHSESSQQSEKANDA